VRIVQKRLTQPITMTKDGDGVVEQRPVLSQQAENVLIALGGQALEEAQRLVRIRRSFKEREQSWKHGFREALRNSVQVLPGPFALAKQAQIDIRARCFAPPTAHKRQHSKVRYLCMRPFQTLK